MTNFQSPELKPKQTLTPERALLVLPIAGGFVLAITAIFFGVVPLAIGLQKSLSLASAMEKKALELPIIRRQLDEAIRQYNLKKAQQERLIGLVAGTSALRTWLLTINRLANLEEVSILQVEPQPRQVYVPPPPPAQNTRSKKLPEPQPKMVDPLLLPDIEKRSAVITFQGSFPNLLSFLRRIELLQSVVIASEMELQLIPAATTGNETPRAKTTSTQARMKINFSAYGRIPNSPSSPVSPF